MCTGGASVHPKALEGGGQEGQSSADSLPSISVFRADRSPEVPLLGSSFLSPDRQAKESGWLAMCWPVLQLSVCNAPVCVFLGISSH